MCKHKHISASFFVDLFTFKGLIMATSTEINTAITGILTTGQSYMVDGIQYSAANLETLRKLQNDERGTGGRSNGVRPLFPRVNAGSAAY